MYSVCFQQAPFWPLIQERWSVLSFSVSPVATLLVTSSKGFIYGVTETTDDVARCGAECIKTCDYIKYLLLCVNLCDTVYATGPSAPQREIFSQTLFVWGILMFFSFFNPGTHCQSLTCSWPRIKTPPGLIGCQGARFSPVPSFSPSWKASHIPSLVVHVIQTWCHFPSLMKRGSWATYKIQRIMHVANQA